MSGPQNPRVTQADEAIQALVDNYSTAGANLLDWLDATDLAAMPGKHASEQKWRDWGNDVACRATFRALSQARDVAARHREAAEAASKAEIERLSDFIGDCGKIEAQLRDEFAASKAREAALVEALVDVSASLAAAISLLERGGKAAKRAAPSDRMFDQMVVDYTASLKRARAAFTKEPDA